MNKIFENSGLVDQSVTNQQRSFPDAVTKTFWAILAPFDPFIGFFVTQPLADALALKTFTHGTNFSNYLSIRCFGADPTKGGSTNGSSIIGYGRVLDGCNGHFHLFKDISDISNDITYNINERPVKFKHGRLEPCDHLISITTGNNDSKYKGFNGEVIENGMIQNIPEYEYSVSEFGIERIYALPNVFGSIKISGSRPSSMDKYFVRSIAPMKHAIMSGIVQWAALEEQGTFATCKRILGGITGALTPTISIRASDGDPILSQLETDPDYAFIALRTKQPISTDYIGLAGIIHQGITPNLFQRVKNSPVKVALGMVRLAALCMTIYFKCR